MTSDLREELIAEGAKAADLNELEKLAPLDQWDIQWQCHLDKETRRFRPPEESGPGKEPGEHLTRVRCPKCGLESTYFIGAVTDFHCDDEDECGYD